MNINQIKDKYTCLDYLGDRVVKKVANGYLARAPWREDKHPSLTVTEDGKGWKDHATGERGNLIDMVQRCLNTTDLSRVCEAFGTVTPFSFHQSKTLDEGKEKVKGFAFCDIVTLQNRALYAYLHSRKINISLAKQFLQEAHYGFEIQRTVSTCMRWPTVTTKAATNCVAVATKAVPLQRPSPPTSDARMHQLLSSRGSLTCYLLRHSVVR